MVISEWSFQSRQWKITAILAYVGIQVSGILLAAALPLIFRSMGERNFNILASHCVSLKPFGNWMVGICLIHFIIDVFAVMATLTKKRRFRNLVASVLWIPILFTIALLIWGLVDTADRKRYFSNAWDDMYIDTQYIIQSHFSCCGFNSYLEVNSSLIPVNPSCYAISNEQVFWPTGCYERITSSWLAAVEVTNSDNEVVTVGTSKHNPFLVAFVLSFTMLMVSQLAVFISFVIALSKTPRNNQVFVTAANGIPTDMSVSTSKENIKTVTKSHGNTPKPMDDGGQNENSEKPNQKSKQISDSISSAVGNSFYWLGLKVGTFPKTTIAISLALSVTFTLGMMQRYEQPPGSASFLSKDSPVVQEFNLLSETFVLTERNHRYLVVHGDVLSDSSFQTTLSLDTSMKEITSSLGNNFSSICVKVDTDCDQRSVFEFWSFNETVLIGLSKSEVLAKLNESPLISPVFNDNVDIKQILGGITRSSGNIAAARAHLLQYATRFYDSDWEERFIEVGRRSHGNVQVYVSAASSRRLENRDQFQKELPLLFAGFGLIFIYIILMTGRFSRLEHRTYISLMGVVTAGLSMGAGIGLSATFGLTWSVLHLIAPFLVIGIGVDDMFIILQAWNNVDDDENLNKKSIPEKAAEALKISGASITVTSVTDLVAFAVGASSQLGSFSGFNVYVAVCIILLFFLECTFFLACTVLDQRRRENRYDACFACCVKLDDSYKPGKFSQKEYMNRFFEDGLGRIVLKLPFAICAILATLGVTGLMTYGFYRLPIRYDPDWYLPSDSYVIEFNNQLESFFDIGDAASAYVINADLYAERAKLHTLYTKLESNPNVDNSYLSSWFEEFVGWANTNKGITDVYASSAFADSSAFYNAVREFIAGDGRKYSNDIVFRNNVIVGSKFDYRHIIVSDPTDNIDIMYGIRSDISSVGFSGSAFPYGSTYFIHEITKIIRDEVYRNIGITLGVVFLMVLPLLASLQMSFWVLISVVFTIVDVAGTMYFAGLTIETSTIITLLLSVGLAVDYSAHVAHKFLNLNGARKLRVRVTLGQIGPAVFNGGFSTFLTLSLLSGSSTYSYRVFFTVFVCVVGYGLWNGLVFLPCILGLVGPNAHGSAPEAKLSQRHYRQKKSKQVEYQTQADSTEF